MSLPSPASARRWALVKCVGALVGYITLLGVCVFGLTYEYGQALGYATLEVPYEARVIRCEKQSRKQWRAQVRVQFLHKDVTFEFWSHHTSRRRYFDEGERVNLMVRRTVLNGSDFYEYEIDDGFHRWGHLAIVSFLLLCSGVFGIGKALELRRLLLPPKKRKPW